MREGIGRNRLSDALTQMGSTAASQAAIGIVADQEEEKIEQEQKKFGSNTTAPQINAMSDEALMEEMRRRAEAKQV